MSVPTQTIEIFDTLAKVLIRCTGLGVVVLMIWVGFFVFLPDVVYQVHGDLFGLSKSELNVIHYSGMGLLKLVVFTFFFFPWLAIRWVLRKE